MTDIQKSIWIDAAPDIVFPYFTDSEKASLWAGVRAELNPVPGGLYRLDMGSAGVFEGKFLKIDPGRFVSWEVGPHGNDEVPRSTIQITIIPEAGGSRVEVRQSGLTPPFDMMASRGWDHHLARLSVSALGGSPGADPFCQRQLKSLT